MPIGNGWRGIFAGRGHGRPCAQAASAISAIFADNCVDRHAENPLTAGRTAIIWEGEDGAVRTLNYHALRDAVSRLANGLKALGIGKGDVVAIYLPNLPEAFVAIHACNRIGAIYTVLFAGFSPDAVALRLRTARAKLVVTADGSLRRGRVIPLLDNLRQARRDAPSVEHIVVIDRTGHRPPLTDGGLKARQHSRRDGAGA